MPAPRGAASPARACVALQPRACVAAALCHTRVVPLGEAVWCTALTRSPCSAASRSQRRTRSLTRAHPPCSAAGATPAGQGAAR
eukprot:1624875-Prymnesium_polylepis.1